MKKTHSFPYAAEQQLIQHQNAVEILAKLDQLMTSDQTHVSIEMTDPETGAVQQTEVVTVGNLHSRITRMEENFKILAGLNGNTAAVYAANNAFKRIVLADVNLEPNDISQLNTINTFRSDKNWFFDAMMNPALSVEFDLTNKVQQGVRKIQSRRFIVSFSRDADGNLTADGEVRNKEFDTKYKGRNDIDITEFVTWLTTNPGLMYRNDPQLDEQMFDLLPHRLKYNGTFTVQGSELDKINQKMWYKLNTLTYQDVSNVAAVPIEKTLAVGDEVAVVPNMADQAATTVYTVVEISTVTSDFRVRFELKTGQDPIPARINALKIYSPVVYDKRVRVTVGFDEYNVIFVKALDANNHLLAKNWSKGTGFYTNDLRLNSTTGSTLKDYYVRTVYDYGAALKDLVAKKIPTDQGIQPIPPNLIADNFKVVQINKHLTDTVDAEKVRELNQQLNTYKSEVEQLQTAVQQKQKQISNTRYTSDAERNADNAELNQLTESFKSKNELTTSILKKILQQKKNINAIEPKFRVRGFWAMPDPIEAPGTTPQEVVQFEINYRYSSRSGSQPQLEQFDIASPLDSESFVAQNRNTVLSTVQSKRNVVNKLRATFANWVAIKTDKRNQVFDSSIGEYKWVVEDLENADTPNINQLDISLSPGERVEIRVRSLSEVGWPEAPLMSEWSEPITIEFPQDLTSVLSEDDFILREAAQEEQRIRFIKELDSKGFSGHMSTGFTTEDKSYAHTAAHIASGQLDSNNKMISLHDMVQKLINEIASLKEIVSRAKGELRVRVFKGSQEYTIENGGELNLTVELEDYASVAKIGTVNQFVLPSNRRTYANDVYTITDYILQIDNIAAENQLGILSNRLYAASTSVGTPFAFQIDKPQAIWVDDNDNIITDFNPSTKTQNNYQWIWQQNIDVRGENLSSWGSTVESDHLNPERARLALASANKNLGLAPILLTEPPVGTTRINNPAWWEVPTQLQPPFETMAATVHPKITSLADITEAGSEKLRLLGAGGKGSVKIPLHIYWKFDTYKHTDNLITKDQASNANLGWPTVTYGLETISKNVIVIFSHNGGQLSPGDEIMLTGVTNLPDINNQILRVIAAAGNNVIVDYPSNTQPEGGRLLYVSKNTNKNAGVYVKTNYVNPANDQPAAKSIFQITSSEAVPEMRKRTVRFFLEPESLARPFQFTINFNLRQFSPVATSRLSTI